MTPKKFRDQRLERITSSKLDRYTTGGESKMYRDPRLDRVTSHTLDIFSKQNKLDVIRKPTGIGIEHLNTAGSDRFKRHDLPPQNPVEGRRYSGVVRSRATLLSGSMKDEGIVKPKAGEDNQTRMGGKIDSETEKIRQELKRRR